MGEINALGADGWELIAIAYIPIVQPGRLAAAQSGIGDHTEYVFKRQVANG